MKENHTWPALAYAPRAGFAYDLHGNQKAVVRGGFGIFYDRPTGNTMFATVTNPPASTTVIVNNGSLANLRSGIQVSAPPALTMYDFDAKLPTSYQWNAGLQVALAVVVGPRLSYVGQRGQNLLGAIDVNGPDFGAAYLPANQNPTLAASTVPGATSLPVNFYRPFQGYGAINRTLMVAYNDFHSLQASLNRRFSHGVSTTFNYTLSRNKGTDGNGLRVTRDADGQVVLRDDYREASYHTTTNDRTHVVRANFVWDLPDLETGSSFGRVLAALANDWQVSGIFSGGSGAPYTVGYTYAGGIGAQNLTGSPNYNARIVIAGDPGQRLLERPHASVQHFGVPGAAALQPRTRVRAQLHARVPGSDPRSGVGAQRAARRLAAVPGPRRSV